MSELYGVDLSSFQGTVDWDALNAVANFALIRATDGTITDSQFARNQSEARRVQASAGPLGIGYYTHTYPTLLTPAASANYLLSVLDPLQEGEWIAHDLEGTLGPDPVTWSLDFAKVIYGLTGIRPPIYLNQSEVSSYNWQPLIDFGCGLWLADYSGTKADPAPATPWAVVAVRQWTDTDIVNGIVTKTDGDTFYGDFNAWNAYGYHVPIAPVASTPTPAQASAPTVATQPAPDPTGSPVLATPAPVDSITAPPVIITPINKSTSMARYSKFFMALAGTLVMYGSTYYSSNHWVSLVLGLLTSAGVVAIPNAPSTSVK